jgi:hypothetical protein
VALNKVQTREQRSRRTCPANETATDRARTRLRGGRIYDGIELDEDKGNREDDAAQRHHAGCNRGQVGLRRGCQLVEAVGEKLSLEARHEEAGSDAHSCVECRYQPRLHPLPRKSAADSGIAALTNGERPLATPAVKAPEGLEFAPSWPPPCNDSRFVDFDQWSGHFRS